MPGEGAARAHRRRRTSAGARGLVALLTLLLVLALPATGRAQEVPQLTGPVTDLTDARVLARGRAEIDAALAELLRSHGVQLWVLFVESTDRRTVTAFADDVARRNSLGSNDALLVVALRDRTDALWRGSRSLERLTDRELEDVLSRRVEPLLARGDFPGAVVGAARGVGGAAAPEASGAGPAPTAPGDLSSGVMVVALLVLAGGGFWLWGAFSARRRARRAAEAREREIERLAHRANELLIQTDEALRDAQEEIGFAEAQFGEAEVVAYREATARGSEELKAAFVVRQRLDDDVPEDLDTRGRMVQEILDRATRAQALLAEQEQRIGELRDLERTAPEVLAALPAQLDALEARLPEAERTLAGLARYAERTWASVKNNADRVRELLSGAREAIGEGQRALSAADRSAAARSARTAQQAAGEIARLLDAVATLAASMRRAEETVRAQIVAAASDVQAARRALAVGGEAGLAGRMAGAETALAQAQREMTADRPDPLAAVQLAAQADAAADEILAVVKQEEERRERESRILLAQLQTAEASYDRAAAYVATRRRAVGWTARTRLAEAERHLARARALASDDPPSALAEARRAQELADDAFAAARRNLETLDPRGGWTGFPRGGLPIPFPFPTGGGWGGPSRGGGGGGSVGGSWGGGGGGSVGGRW
jgi:uncharacterized membrane protein YgcG